MMTGSKQSRRTVLQEIVLPTPDSAQQQAGALPLSARRGIHPGLWLDKYIESLERENTTARSQLVRQVASLPVPEIYEQFYTNWLNHLKDERVKAKTRAFAVKGRMAVGLGNECVLETSIALHRTYGVPYIPGSALKGLAASYARLMAGEDWQSDGPAYKTVFGETDNAGYLTFFDALYIPRSAGRTAAACSNNEPDCPLCPDIITVHHPNYYRGKENAAPADWDSPTPISFLSATGSYLIALAAPDLDNADAWLEQTFELLTQALLILGIGAKTSSGYGRMKVDEDKPTSKIPLPKATASANLTSEISHVRDVRSQMYGYYQRWKLLEAEDARKIVAQAIIDKIAQVHCEKWAASRGWYQELQAFLATSSSD